MTEDFPLLPLVSDRCKNRNPVYFWQDVPVVENAHKDPIQLVGGLPNYGFFPVTGANVQLREEPFKGGHDDLSFQIKDVSTRDDEVDIKSSFQYSDQNGQIELRNQIKEFVKRVVKPVSNDWDIVCTLGGLDGIMKCFDIFINPGDTVLIEEFTFTPVLNNLVEFGGIPIPIKLNNLIKDHKIDYVDELENMLNNWDTIHPNLSKPKMLYTIPNGHNPLGLAQSLDHKKRIYQLAELHNFIILEDEPYSYLNFTKYDETPNYNLTNDEFINSLNPSFTTMDTTGRVIRIETFSKIYAPGLRLGYMVINKAFINLFTKSGELLTRAPSGFSQIFVNNTIIKLGGIEGWIQWITKVRNEYLKRKNHFINSLMKTKAFKEGYLTPIDPNCGMFVSIIINIEKSNEFNGINYNQLMDKFYINSAQIGVLAVLGRNMSVKSEFSTERSNFIRTAISFVDDVSILDLAAQRLSDATCKLFE